MIHYKRLIRYIATYQFNTLNYDKFYETTY